MDTSRTGNASSARKIVPKKPQYQVPQKQKKTGVQMDKDDRTKMNDIEMKKNNRVFDYVKKQKRQNETSRILTNSIKHF